MDYVHTRLSREDADLLRRLVEHTGQTRSEILRRGLRAVERELAPKRSALDLARPWVGIFKTGPSDLSTNPKHMEGFGE